MVPSGWITWNSEQKMLYIQYIGHYKTVLRKILFSSLKPVRHNLIGHNLQENRQDMLHEECYFKLLL